MISLRPSSEDEESTPGWLLAGMEEVIGGFSLLLHFLLGKLLEAMIHRANTCVLRFSELCRILSRISMDEIYGIKPIPCHRSTWVMFRHMCLDKVISDVCYWLTTIISSTRILLQKSSVIAKQEDVVPYRISETHYPKLNKYIRIVTIRSHKSMGSRLSYSYTVSEFICSNATTHSVQQTP